MRNVMTCALAVTALLTWVGAGPAGPAAQAQPAATPAATQAQPVGAIGPATRPASSPAAGAETRAATQPASGPATRPAPPVPPAPRRDDRSACLAARADALGKLAEQAAALKITEQVEVGGFLASSDDLRPALAAALAAGAAEATPPACRPDGTCEVQLAVPVAALAGDLKYLCLRGYRGDKVRPADFDAMPSLNGARELRAAGQGSPRPELAGPAGMDLEPGVEPRPAGAAAAFWAAHCTDRGRLLAERAARLDALRRLAEQIGRVPIDPESGVLVGTFVAAADDPNVDLRTFLRGARQTGVGYWDDMLIVQARVEIRLRTVRAALRSWGMAHLRGDREPLRRLENIIVHGEDRALSAVGLGAPPEGEMTDATAEIRRTAALAAAGPEWAPDALRAVGAAAVDPNASDPAAAEAAALRAARIEARLELARAVRAAPVAPDITVGDLAGRNADFAASLHVFLQGDAAHPGEGRIASDRRATAHVEASWETLWHMVLYYARRQPGFLSR